MIGSRNGVSCGAETVILEKEFCSLRSNRRLVLPVERRGYWSAGEGTCGAAAQTPALDANDQTKTWL